MSDFEPLLDEPNTCGHLGISYSTLRGLRRAGAGPRYVRVGGSIRYRLRDIEAWLDANTTGGARP
jgi:predicted DNA-binding transcriptional regulator AlpA